MKITLADLTIEIKNRYPYAEEYCRDYVAEADAVPDLSFSVQESDISFEREKVALEVAAMGFPLHSYSDEYLETLAIYRKIAEAAPSRQVILFHGSAIAIDGIAFLFTAKSGTGKSTHARLLRELLGDRAVMINDDKPLLKITDQGVTVYGTPWNGKHHLGMNASAPLKAICLLERGVQNEITPISFLDAFPMLLQQCYRPADQEQMLKTLSLLNQLEKTVRFYRLRCNVERDAAITSYSTLKELVKPYETTDN